ncbi:MAG TPA: hypothetical protein VGL89_08385 [Candidatus Koribacter sp.]|jgi:hypothetical protein
MKSLSLLVLFLLAFVACQSKPAGNSNSTSSAPAKTAQYETGREAFQKTYIAAHNWAPDAKPFRLESQYTPDAPVSEGKAGIWRASFGSAARHGMESFQWTGIVSPDTEQGISHGSEDSFSPTNTSTQTFDSAFLKIDSDKAYEIAEKHGGEKLTKADAKIPVFFTLDWDHQKNKLIWHVAYGSNGDDAKLRVAVDATDGSFIRVEK